MERAKKHRAPLRTAITKTINDLEDEYILANPDFLKMKEKIKKVEFLSRKIEEWDTQVLNGLLEASDADFEAESNEIEKYQDKVRYIRIKVYDFLPLPDPQPVVPSVAQPVVPVPVFDVHQQDAASRRHFKLPKIEIRKFSGDLKEWLGWWAQFEKIHQDAELHPSDKIQYLLQATVEGSKARRIVEGYPQTSENYPKVIDALEDRFGDKVLLTELYVRQLAGLVISNASKSRSQPLGCMYDELDASLRALESLGVTSDQSAAFLYPLVESSLPEDILKVWQRSPMSGYDDDGDEEKNVDERLRSLMKFLKKEVKGQERLTFVNAGIDMHERKRFRQQTRSSPMSPSQDCPTAAGLFSGESIKCIFCDKSHDSKDCGRASNMSLDEKRGKISQKRACFVCLRPGHGAKKCRAFVRCAVCGKKHFVVVCPDLATMKISHVSSKPSEAQGDIQSAMASITSSPSTVLQTLKIKVVGRTNSLTVRALIDSGAQRSYILSSTASKIGLKSYAKQPLIHALFGGGVSDRRIYNEYRVEVHSLGLGEKVTLCMYGQDKICTSLPPIPQGSWLQELKRQGIVLSDCLPGNEDIQILLGADSLAAIMTGEFKRIHPELVAVGTKLGWTVIGKTAIAEPQEQMSLMVIQCMMNVNDIENLWKLEAIGIHDPIEVQTTQEREAEVQSYFLRTVSRDEDGRYVVSLPWKPDHVDIPVNFNVARTRLTSATAKLKDTQMYDTYDQIFKDWLKEGIIEQVEMKMMSCHYLPHRAVLKPESMTTPVRPVFDASARVKGQPSLNDLLEKGSNMIELIPAILLRFRRFRVGASADIRKAFQMIKVNEPDRDYQRFLWWNGSGELIVYRHARVVFGINCSPFLLAAVLHYHMTQDKRAFDDKFCTDFLESLYVDNCVLSFETLKEFEQFKEKSTSVIASARMELRLWEHSLVEESGIDRLSGNWCGLETDKPPRDDALHVVNILGMKWNKLKDTLSIVVPKSEVIDKVSRRVLLSYSAQVFDPIGLVSPALLPPKLLLKKSWKTKGGWDEPVDEETCGKFLEWKRSLIDLPNIEIPRHAFVSWNSKCNLQLHVFCDASLDAYAAAAFIRVQSESGVHVSLLQSKSRVAPLKKNTIPRLELLGCLIGARLGKNVCESLSLGEIDRFYWTDSSTALAWITRADKWGVFVSNRVKEINSITKSTEWRHVPGIHNPADLPSRGCNFTQLKTSRWWEGPEWLRDISSNWPRSKNAPEEELVNSEQRKTTFTLTVAPVEKAWYFRISSYSKNIRVLAWALRFLQKCKRVKGLNTDELSTDELIDAEMKLWKLIQIGTVSSVGDNHSGLKLARGIDGILRVVTKLTNRKDSECFKFPVLLPSNHYLVEQLIRHTHQTNSHAGVQTLMTILRERVWIQKARRTIKSVVKNCVICQRFTSKNIATEPTALPSDRVQSSSAFEVTGIDLAGPLFLKDKSKVWVVLFTCAMYRCVHMELIESLSTEGFLFALHKFICRRGRPSVIWSDNGTNFRGSNEAFGTLDWKRIQRDTGNFRIKWKFIPPSAAWWGGWWERLIRVVKDLLKRMLGHSKLNFLQLESVLCDAESTVNSRPLTYVSEDDDDLIPLTPKLFMQDLSSIDFPEMQELDSDGIRKKAKALGVLRFELKERFRKEYLSQLVDRRNIKVTKPLSIGDIVLVGSDMKKRLLWPMGRIVELLPGADAKTRVAKVRVKDGVLVRPVQRLYPLEIPFSIDLPVQPDVIQKSKELDKIQEDEGVVTRFGRRVKKTKFYSAN